ncbi:hypothetical protein GC173_11290 [bacterium]|nr:hypothetical protein [bacterium]
MEAISPSHAEPIRRFEAVACALLAVVFYAPLLRLDAMQSGGDAANLFWPVKFLLTESIFHRGVVPLWNPWSFMGAPLLASLQHAVLYPPDWLLYGFLPPHMAMNIGNLLHLSLAAVGTWVWLRVALGCTRWPSVVLGGVFPCVAWFWGHQEHINQVAAASYIPLLTALGWLFLLRRLSIRAFALSYAGCSALQFLTGHPQEAFYGHLLMALLGLYALAKHRRDRAWLLRTASGVALAGVLTGLLVAVQLLPTLELNKDSRRQFRDPLYAISFSMPPDVLLTHLIPHREGSFRDGYFLKDADGNPVLDEAGNPGWNRRAFGEYGVHVGVPVLVLALLAFADTRRRRAALGLACLYVLFAALALGGNTDPRRILALDFTEFPQPGYSLHELFLGILPPAQGFRVPARIILLGSFALVTMAAFGFDWLLSRAASRRIHVAVAVGLVVYTALWLPARKEKFNYPAEVEEPLLVLNTVTRPEASLDDRGTRLTLSDDDSLVRERHLETTFGRGNPITWRAASLQPHLNVMARVPMVDGYEEGLVPTARFKDFQHAFNRNFRQFQPDAELLALLGVSHIFAELPVDPNAFPPDEAASLPGAPAFRNPLAKGAAFFREGTGDIDFSRIDGPFWRGGEPLTGYATEQVSFGQLDRPQWLAAPRLTTTLPTVNSIRIDSPPGTSMREGLIALGWYRGWVVESGDGSTAPIEFISAVHGVLPGPASRQVSTESGPGWLLLYRPFSYRAGLFLTALGFGLAGFVLGNRRRVR